MIATAGVGAVGSGGSGGSLGALGGLMSNPVTAIAGAALGIGLLIKNIFSAHHAQAVKTEAQALNDAVTRVKTSIQTIFAGLNAGTVKPNDAITALDSIPGGYESLVYKQYGVKQKAGNGPDVVEKNNIDVWVQKAKDLITGGGGSYTTTQMWAHAGFQGQDPWSITYAPPVTSSVDSAASAVASKFAGLSSGAKVAVVAVAVLIFFWVVS